MYTNFFVNFYLNDAHLRYLFHKYLLPNLLKRKLAKEVIYTHTSMCLHTCMNDHEIHVYIRKRIRTNTHNDILIYI